MILIYTIKRYSSLFITINEIKRSNNNIDQLIFFSFFLQSLNNPSFCGEFEQKAPQFGELIYNMRIKG